MKSRQFVFIGITISLLVTSVYAQEIETKKIENKVYSHIDTDGILLASSKKYYLEEFDALNRPVSATSWEAELIVKETTWLYEGNQAQAIKKIETEKNYIREELFDTKGRLKFVEIKDTAGLVIEKNQWVRDSEDRLISYTHIKNSVRDLTEWDYLAGESILEKRIFRNGTLVSKSVYSDEDNWIETIFKNSVPVLVVVWIDGVRVNEVKK